MSFLYCYRLESSGKRQYTDEEFEIIKAVKAMRESGVGFELIRDRLEKKDQQEAEITPTNDPTNGLVAMQNFMKVMSKQLRKELSEEFRSELEASRQEVADARKQIESLQKEIAETRQQVAVSSEEVTNCGDGAIAGTGKASAPFFSLSFKEEKGFYFCSNLSSLLIEV